MFLSEISAPFDPNSSCKTLSRRSKSYPTKLIAAPIATELAIFDESAFSLESLSKGIFNKFLPFSFTPIFSPSNNIIPFSTNSSLCSVIDILSKAIMTLICSVKFSTLLSLILIW